MHLRTAANVTLEDEASHAVTRYINVKVWIEDRLALSAEEGPAAPLSIRSAFKSNRREECAQMPRKNGQLGPANTFGDQTCRPPTTTRVGTSGLARKTLLSTPKFHPGNVD